MPRPRWLGGRPGSSSDGRTASTDLILSVRSSAELSAQLEPLTANAWYEAVRYAHPAHPDRTFSYPWLPLPFEEGPPRPDATLLLTLGLHVVDFPGGVLHLFVDVDEDGHASLRGPSGDGQAEVDVELLAADLARWAGGRQSLPDLLPRATVLGDAFLMGAFSYLVEAPSGGSGPPSLELIAVIESFLRARSIALENGGAPSSAGYSSPMA